MPLLPPEILNRIIHLTLCEDLNRTVLGYFADDVTISRTLDQSHMLTTDDGQQWPSSKIGRSLGLYNAFLNPFMQVDRSCRAEVLYAIGRQPWIQLRTLDRQHMDKLTDLLHQFPVLDPFWKELLLPAQPSRIIFEFGHRQIAPRSSKQRLADKNGVLLPYSYAVFLHLISELGLKPKATELLVMQSENVLAEVVQEMSRVLPFLDVPLSTSYLETSKAGQLNFIFEKQEHPSLNSVTDNLSRVQTLLADLQESQKEDDNLRRSLLLLYMCRYLVKKAEVGVRSASFWVKDYLVGPGDANSWRPNEFAIQHVKIARTFFNLENQAWEVFQDLHTQEPTWVHLHAPYLTNDFDRWVREPRFQYFGISNEELAEYYHSVGAAISTYMTMANWLSMARKPPYPQKVFWSMLQRKRAFLVSSHLQPGNQAWADDFEQSTKDLVESFPTEMKHRDVPDYTVHPYTDVDGAERVWLQVYISSWTTDILPYVPRAQRIVV